MGQQADVVRILRDILSELKKLNKKMDRQWQHNVTIHAPQPTTIEPISRPPRF